MPPLTKPQADDRPEPTDEVAGEARERDDRSDRDDRAAAMREQRRQQILDAAKEVFAERGYHAASINAIIKQADIARGTFYLYFSNKHKVFDAILGEALGELRGRITRIELGEGHPPPQAQLRDNFVRVFDYVLGEPLLVQVFINQAQTADTEVADRVGAFWNHLTALVQSSLTYGISLGLVRPCDTGLVASALLGAVRGIVSHLLATDRPGTSAQIADELMAFVFGGVLDPASWGRDRSI